MDNEVLEIRFGMKVRFDGRSLKVEFIDDQTIGVNNQRFLDVSKKYICGALMQLVRDGTGVAAEDWEEGEEE